MILSPKQTALGALFVVAAVAAPAWAETAASSKGLTLEGAVDEGLRNSPSVQRAEASYQEIASKKLSAYAGFLPRLDLSAQYNFEKRYQFIDLDFGGAPAHVPQIVPTAATTLTATLPVFDGFANVNRFSAASASEKAALANFEWTRFQSEEDLRLKFYQALAAQELKSVADQNLQTIQEHLDQIQAMKKGGIATQYDVLRVEVQLSEAKTDVLKSGDDVVLARQKLASTMGAANDDSRALQGELEKPAPAKVEGIRQGALSERKDIEALEKRASALDSIDTAGSKYWVPKVSLGANYILYNNLTDNLNDWEKYRAAWTAGVYLSWNLFDGMISISEAKQEKYRAVQAEKSLDEARLNAPVDFEFWKRRYLYSSALYDAKKAEQDKATESVRLAKAGFKAGVRTNTEILDAELDLFRARAGVVNALLGCIEAKAKLELALGKKI